MLKRNQCPVCKTEDFQEYLHLNDFFLTNEAFTLLQCKQCELLVTDPYPNKASSAFYYESKAYLSHQVDKKSLFSVIYNLIKVVNIKSKFKFATKGLKTDRILDIGCGIGDFLSYCKENEWEVYGIEPNEKAREFAQNKIKKNIFETIGPNTCEKEKFRLITLWHVLEHIHELDQQLNEIRSNLKIDGKLVIAVPNFESYDAKYYNEFWAAYDVPRHLYHFNRKAVIKLMDNHGFKLVDEKAMFWDAYYVAILSEKYRKSSMLKGLLNAIVIASLSNIKALSTKMSSSVMYAFEMK